MTRRQFRQSADQAQDGATPLSATSGINQKNLSSALQDAQGPKRTSNFGAQAPSEHIIQENSSTEEEIDHESMKLVQSLQHIIDSIKNGQIYQD